MPYSETELQTFKEILCMLREEFKDFLQITKKKKLLEALLQDLLIITFNTAQLKCYTTLIEFLSGDSNNMKILTHIAIEMVLLELDEQTAEANALYESLINGGESTFKYAFLTDDTNIKNYIMEAIPHAPYLTTLDLTQKLTVSPKPGFWNIGSVKLLMQAIHQMPHLITLDLGRNELDKWDFEAVKLLFGAIQHSPNLTTLGLSSNNLQYWNLERVKLLTQAIQQVPYLTTLDLSFNNLCTWDLECIKLLAQAIQHAPHLTTLGLSSNNLQYWNLERVKLLTQAIQQAPYLTTLDLSFNNLCTWDLECIKLLAQAIQHAPHLTTLNIGGNELGHWEIECVKFFSQAIQHAPHLTILDICVIELGSWNMERVKLFAHAIQQAPHLTTLNIGGNELGHWEIECVKFFSQAIQQAPRLTSLDIGGNELGSWDLERVKLFTQTIQHAPHLTTLDIRGNELGSWDMERVKLFTQAIQQAPRLTSLDIGGNELSNWDMECVKLLTQAIQQASHLTTLNLSRNYLGSWHPERVKLLTEAIREIHNLTILDLSVNNLKLWDNRCTQALEDTIANNFSLTSIMGIEDLPAEVATNIQTYLKRNKLIASHVERLDNFFIKQAPESTLINITQEDYDKLIELESLLNSKIPNPKIPSFQNYLQRLEIIRFEVFQLIWSTTQDFLHALPWCLDHNENLIFLKENQQQIIFDASLAAAVGTKITLDKIDSAFSNEQRLILFKYLLLKNVNEIDPLIKFQVHTPTFFTKTSIAIPTNASSTTDKIPVSVILEQADVINEHYEKFPNDFNFENLPGDNAKSLSMLRNVITNFEQLLKRPNTAPTLTL